MTDQATTTKQIDHPRFTVPVPPRMAHLPRDERGYIVPYFVQYLKDGKPAMPSMAGALPDFRVINTRNFVHCVKSDLCWICAGRLGVHRVHLIGPMCSINRITSEPPTHLVCADYALKVCPFMMQPRMKRDLDFTEIEGGVVGPGGIHDKGNPGTMVMWTTKERGTWEEIGSGWLLHLAAPTDVKWFTMGRLATYAEAELALVEGLTKLEKIARSHDKTPEALATLFRLYQTARQFLPPEVPHPKQS